MSDDRRLSDLLEQVQDPAAREALKRILARTGAAIDRLARRTFLLLGVAIVLSFAGGILSASLQVRYGIAASKADKAALQAASAAEEAKALAAQSVLLAAAIQQSRLELTRDQCEQQNRQHDASIRTLRRVAARTSAPPGQTAAQRAEGVTAFIFIINAQTPRRDCAAVVEKVRLSLLPHPPHDPPFLRTR